MERELYEPEELKRIEDANERIRSKREKELNDLNNVLSSASGRRFIWRLLAQCGIFRRTWVQGEPDTTAFNEGLRDIGLKLLEDIEIARPGSYAQMHNEYMSSELKPKEGE